MLQQHCQQSGWGPPKFEKLTPGGDRLAAAGIRYAVSVAVPREAKGGKKQRGLQQKAFQLGEHEDGWETINDAQNAVATLVLYEVGSQQGVFSQMSPNWVMILQHTTMCKSSEFNISASLVYRLATTRESGCPGARAQLRRW